MDIKEAKTAVKAIFLQAASMSGFEVSDQSPSRFADLIQKGFSKVNQKRKPEAVANILRVIASTLVEAQKDKLKVLNESSVDKGNRKFALFIHSIKLIFMDTTEKSFEFASESSKLLITLSTGVIAFMIAFLDKDSSMMPENNSEKTILIVSWIIFLSSAIVGVWTQLAFTDILEPSTKPDPFMPTIRDKKIKFPFRSQIVLFALGILTTVVYGIIRLL